MYWCCLEDTMAWSAVLLLVQSGPVDAGSSTLFSGFICHVVSASSYLEDPNLLKQGG